MAKRRSAITIVLNLAYRSPLGLLPTNCDMKRQKSRASLCARSLPRYKCTQNRICIYTRTHMRKIDQYFPRKSIMSRTILHMASTIQTSIIHGNTRCHITENREKRQLFIPHTASTTHIFIIYENTRCQFILCITYKAKSWRKNNNNKLFNREIRKKTAILINKNLAPWISLASSKLHGARTYIDTLLMESFEYLGASSDVAGHPGHLEHPADT